MSKEIDEKVVELRFNNSNFEKNARATMSTIEKLEQKLNFKGAAKGLENVDKAANSIKFTVLSDAVDKVSVKFSALQVAALTALQNITNKAIDTGEKLVKSLTVDQISAGWAKYEAVTTSTQTIMAATGDSIDTVSKSLDKLNWFTDETSYSFSDMADNIGKFTSAGQTLDDSTSAMMGIATAAALAGQNTQKATHAMNNFSQAMGTGFMGLQDWKSIETANMATEEFKQTLIDTAIELGTLERVGDVVRVTGESTEVTTTAFRDTLKKQWMTSDVMIKALKKYGEYSEYLYGVVQETGLSAADAMELVGDNAMELGAKAFRAAQEAKTFTDAIEATKDAVSTGWMKTFQLLFGNYIEAKETWTDLTDRLYTLFAEGGNFRNKILTGAMTSSLDQFKVKVRDAGGDVDEFEQKLIDLARESGIEIDRLIDKYESLDGVLTNVEAKSYSDQIVKLIPKALRSLAGEADNATLSTEDLNAKLEEYNDLVYRIAVKGEFGNGQTRFAALEQMGYDWREIQGYVNKFVDSGYTAKLTIDDLSDAELKNIGYTDDEINKLRELADEAETTGSDINELINSMSKPSGRVLLAESMMNILDALIHVIDTVKEAWSEIFPTPTAEMIYNVIERFHAFTENLMLNEERTDQLKRTFKGLFAVLDVIKQVVVAVVQNGFNLLGRVMNIAGIDVLEFTATLGDNLVEIRNWLNEGNKITAVVEWISNGIASLISNFKELGIQLINSDKVSVFIQNLRSKFEEHFPGIVEWFDGLKEAFGEFFKKLQNLDDFSFENLKVVFTDLGDILYDYFFSIDISEFKNKLKDIWLVVVNFFKDIRNNVWNFVKDMTSALRETIKNLNPLAIVLVAAGATLLLLGQSVITTVDTLIKTIRPLSTAVKGLVDAAKGFVSEGSKAIKRMSKAFSLALSAAALVEFALAIGLLTVAIYALTKIDPGELWTAIGAITALAILLTGMSVAISVFGRNSGALTASAAVFISLAAAVLILSHAVKQFEYVKLTDIIKALYGIFNVTAFLTIAIVILSQFSGEATNFSVSLLVFTTAILLMTVAITKLQNTDISGVTGKLLGLGLIITAILALSKFTSGDSVSHLANAFGLIGFIVALNLLIATIANIRDTDLEIVRSHLLEFVAIFTLFSIAVAVSKHAGEFAAKAGVAIVAMSVSILILISAVKRFAEINESELTKAGKIIGNLMIVFGLVTMASKLAGEHALKAGGMILMMSVAINALAIVLWGLSLLDEKGITRATIVVDSILVLFAVLLKVSNVNDKAKEAIVSMTVCLGILMLGLGVLLAFHSADELFKTSEGIALVLISLIGNFYVIQKANIKFEKVRATLATLGIMLIGVAAVISVMQILPISSDGIIQKAGALAILMLALSFVIKSMSGIDFDNVSAGKLSSMALFATELSGVMAILAGIIFGLSFIKIENITSFWTVLGGLTALFAALSLVAGVLAKFEFKDMHNQQQMALFLGELSIVLLLLTYVMKQLNDLNPEGMIVKVTSLSILLGAISLVGGVLSAITFDMSKIGMALAMLGGLTGICIGLAFALKLMQGIDLEKGLVQVGLLSAVLAAITITAFVAAGLGAVIAAVGPVALLGLLGMALIIAAIGGIIVAIGALYNDPVTGYMINGGFEALGEMLGSFIGGLVNAFAEVSGDNLTETVQSVKDACDIIATIDPTAIDVLTHIMDSVGQVATSLSVSGIFGSSDWSSVTEGLVELANAMNDYADSVAALDATDIAAIQNSIAPTESLIEVLDKIPKTDGFLPTIFGNPSWKTLASGLALYGYALCSFAGVLTGKYIPNEQDSMFGTKAAPALTPTSIMAIKTALPITDSLITLLGKLPAADGYWQYLTGGKDWETLSQGLAGYGMALCLFSGYVSGVWEDQGWPRPDAEAIQNAVGCSEALLNVMKSIPDANEQKSLLTKLNGAGLDAKSETNYWSIITNGLTEYGMALSSFGATAKTLYTSGAAVSINYIGTATQSLIEAIRIISELDSLKKYFKDGIWKVFYGGLNDYGDALVKFADKTTNLDKSTIENAASASKSLVEVFKGDDFNKDSMKSFIDKLDKLGKGLADFSKEISGSNLTNELVSTVSFAIRTIEAMSLLTLSAKIDSKFLTGLQDYGSALKDFATNTKDIEFSNVTKSFSTISEMLTAYGNAVEEYNNTYSFGTRTSNSLTAFSNKLLEFGKDIKEYADTIEGLQTGSRQLDYYFNVSSGFVKKWMDVAETITSDKIQSLKDFGKALKTYGDDLQGFTNRLENVDDSKFNMVGKYLVDGIALGIQQETPELITSINTMADTAVEALRKRLGINSPSKITKEDGKYYVEGFVEGVDNNAIYAMRSVVSLAADIIESFNDKMGIHSASDEMISSGEFTLDGLIEGIQNKWGDVTSTVKNLATSVVENFDISKIADMGGNITAILSGDFSSLTDQFNKIDYTSKMEEFTNQLQAMTAAGLQDTDAFKELQKQMNDFQSANSSTYNYVLKEELNEAQGLYDRLLDDFKKGKVSAADFDKQYVNLLKKYSDQAGSLIDYHKSKMSDYISGSLDEIQSKFEDKIKDINSKMQTLQGNLAKTYDDALIFTTNKDVYDKKVSEYETRIAKLNRELNETQKRYGENSAQANKLQNELRLVNEEMESYKSFYETEGFKDDEIVDIGWSEELVKETDALFGYADAIEQMISKRGKDLTDPLIEYLGTLDQEKGKRTVDWLNSLSEEEFARMSAELSANAEAARRVAEMLYRPQMEAATEEFDTAVTELRNKLPDTAVSIGTDIAKGLTNGFAEEVENSLERIGTSGDKLLDALKKRFGIHSPSTVAKEEIGYNLADGVINGVIERLTASTERMVEAVRGFVYTAFSPFIFDEDGNNPIATEFTKVIASINEALTSGIETEPVIRPVLDLSNVYNGMGEINSMFGYQSANEINSSINAAREVQNGPQIATTADKPSGTTVNNFTQNNYSPKTLSRREIARDTRSLFQAATMANR